jgi:hypothetical protein
MLKTTVSVDEQLDFFEQLAPYSAFADAVDPRNHVAAPPSWVVIVTDIRDSSRAVEEGRYKAVNVVGAASIACVLNSCGAPRPPYVFGGDGALMLVPGSRRIRVGAALNRLAWLARVQFDLSLRAGAVPVAELAARGLEVKVAKYALSPHLKLAMFAGAGFDEAMRLVKSEARYSVVKAEPPGGQPPVDGLNCRWEPLTSRNGEMVSLITKATSPDPAAQADVYRSLLQFLDALFEGTDVHPFSPETARLAGEASHFDAEATLKSGRRQGPRHAWQRATIGLVTRIGAALIRKKKRFGGFDGARYPVGILQQSDIRKFDGALRMVLDTTRAQRLELERYLERGYAAGKLVYGVSSSEQALMTCLVYDRERDHVHFIDGADGGYTVAAKRLLERELALHHAPGRR